MEQFGAVAEDHEGRRRRAHLRHIVDAEPLALVGGRLMPRHRVGEQVVQHPGRHAEVRRGVHVVDHLVEVVHPLPGLRGHEDDRGVGHEGEGDPDLFGEAFHAVVVLFDRVPLVDHDDRAFARLVGDPGDLLVLLGDPLLGVDHKQADVGALDGGLRPQNRVVLDAVLDRALTADPGGVDEIELAQFVLDQGAGQGREARVLVRREREAGHNRT